MKRILLSSLSILLLSGAMAPAAQAQITPATPPANAATLGMAVTPFNLVFLAYQGFFESEGISKFNGLVTDHQSGRVSAEDLVQVAIAMRRLSPDTINDRRYLRSVERHLDSLHRSGGN